MKLLITMAGKGTRFREAGVKGPKHEILIRGRPMFDWAMESLKSFFQHEFIFITQSEYSRNGFLETACDRLGIKDYRTVSLEEYTSGQAATAFAARSHVSQDDSIAIYNIDTYVEPDRLSPDSLEGDGFLPVFEASGDRWSFASVTRDMDVTAVAEKEKISSMATVGFYYFDEWRLFKEAYKAASESVRAEYGETYVAPLFNYLIDQGYSVKAQEVDRKKVHVLGTPADAAEFDPSFEVTDS